MGLGVWSTLPSMNVRRCNAAVAELDGYLYVCGGLVEAAELLDSDAVERFNPAMCRWEAVPPMPTARSEAVAVAYKGCLYVCGGTIDNDFRDAVECFNPKTWQWQTMPPLLMRCIQPTVVAIGDHIS